MGRRNTRKLRNAKQLKIRYALFTEGLVTERQWPGLVLWTGCFEGCWLCYWWCCAHWRAYWLGESQPSALWGCSSL